MSAALEGITVVALEQAVAGLAGIEGAAVINGIVGASGLEPSLVALASAPM